MAREAYPDLKEGVNDVSPEIYTIQKADEFRQSVENFFAPESAETTGEQAVIIFDEYMAARGGLANHHEQGELAHQRRELPRLVEGQEIAIYDGQAQYGVLQSTPRVTPERDHVLYQIVIRESGTEQLIERSVYPSQITIIG